MSSGALAVALVAWRERRRRWRYAGVASIFFYTTVVNVIERPEGIKIASIFIVAIIVHVARLPGAAFDGTADRGGAT